MKYSPEGRFPLNSLVIHPILGTGKVVKHIPPNRMDVEFEEGVNRLACGKIFIDEHPATKEELSRIEGSNELGSLAVTTAAAE